MGVDVYGVDVWKKEAAKVINEYPEKGAKFIDKQSKKLANKVRTRTHIGPTGNLKKSWRKTKAKEKKGAIRGEVKSTAPHAHLLEYGHKITKVKGGPVLGFVPGQHMLQTSFNEINAEWDGEMKAWFDNLVKELEI
jgi:hypothetical protein